MTAATTTVHVLDDDDAILNSLRFLLAFAGYAVRTYNRPQSILGTTLPPCGCILTDFLMPEMDGLMLQERLAESGVKLPVIIMTGHGDISSAVRAMKAGAVDFLEKPFADDQLLGAIARALESNRRELETEARAAEASRSLAQLTAREREVVNHIVAGKSNKEIALVLGLSPRTIDVHRLHIFKKLEADSLPDLVRLVLVAQGTSR